MIKDPALVRSFENSLSKREKPEFARNLRVFEALYLEARVLGVLPLKDPLDGIDADIHLAGVLNARKPVGEDRDRSS